MTDNRRQIPGKHRQCDRQDIKGVSALTLRGSAASYGQPSLATTWVVDTHTFTTFFYMLETNLYSQQWRHLHQ